MYWEVEIGDVLGVVEHAEGCWDEAVYISHSFKNYSRCKDVSLSIHIHSSFKPSIRSVRILFVMGCSCFFFNS